MVFTEYIYIRRYEGTYLASIVSTHNSHIHTSGLADHPKDENLHHTYTFVPPMNTQRIRPLENFLSLKPLFIEYDIFYILPSYLRNFYLRTFVAASGDVVIPDSDIVAALPCPEGVVVRRAHL